MEGVAHLPKITDFDPVFVREFGITVRQFQPGQDSQPFGVSIYKAHQWFATQAVLVHAQSALGPAVVRDQQLQNLFFVININRITQTWGLVKAFSVTDATLQNTSMPDLCNVLITMCE